ncbi:VOC family protein [Hamadaea sp. NPDC051192]|uniref:VOC family protein n=1 Tax=Hamadaea sp. NPDC051192 TaxID=3154940 RepID=UPI00342044AA
MSAQVSHFELPVDDLARASEFYSKVFGWNVFTIPTGSTLVGTTPSDADGRPTVPGGINGGLAVRGGAITTPVVTVTVEDIDASLQAVEEHGGKRVQEKVSVGDFGFVAYVTDSEGSVLGLWQNAG